MNAIRHTFLLLAALIFVGHSLVPHTHEDDDHEMAIHDHDDSHTDLGDLLVCFFHVDHESEDFDNFFAPDFSTAARPNSYAVIPNTYFEQKPAWYKSKVPSPPILCAHSLRGPPLG